MHYVVILINYVKDFVIHLSNHPAIAHQKRATNSFHFMVTDASFLFCSKVFVSDLQSPRNKFAIKKQNQICNEQVEKMYFRKNKINSAINDRTISYSIYFYSKARKRTRGQRKLSKVQKAVKVILVSALYHTE